MLDMLKDNIPEELEHLRSAYEAKDWPTMQKVVHRMRGGCCYCGAVRLEEACAQLETAIENNKIELAPSLYKQLLVEIEAVEEALTTERY